METKTKVGFFSSMRFKIILMVTVGALVTSGVIIAILLPTLRKNIQQTNHDYLMDMSVAYGKVVDDAYNAMGDGLISDYEELNNMLSKVKISNLSTSYAYMVSADGTMLYHPTAEKVGNPV